MTQTSIYQIQQKLLEVWSSKHVDEAFQNTFLANLDHLNEPSAKEIMQNEIYNTYNGKSQYDGIKNLNKQRVRILADICKMAQDKQYPLEDGQLSLLCENMSNYRMSNLLLVQACLALGKVQNPKIQEENKSASFIQYSKTFCQYYATLFETINQDNKRIKETVLSKYVELTDNFDPFFMHQYEILKNNEGIVHTEVAKIYDFGLALAYRFMKAKKQMLTCMQTNIKENKWEKKFISSPQFRKINSLQKQKIEGRPRNKIKSISVEPKNQTKSTEFNLPKIGEGKKSAQSSPFISYKQTQRRKKKQKIPIVILDQSEREYQNSLQQNKVLQVQNHKNPIKNDQSQLSQKKWNSQTFKKHKMMKQLDKKFTPIYKSKQYLEQTDQEKSLIEEYIPNDKAFNRHQDPSQNYSQEAVQYGSPERFLKNRLKGYRPLESSFSPQNPNKMCVNEHLPVVAYNRNKSMERGSKKLYPTNDDGIHFSSPGENKRQKIAQSGNLYRNERNPDEFYSELSPNEKYNRGGVSQQESQYNPRRQPIRRSYKSSDKYPQQRQRDREIQKERGRYRSGQRDRQPQIYRQKDARDERANNRQGKRQRERFPERERQHTPSYNEQENAYRSPRVPYKSPPQMRNGSKISSPPVLPKFHQHPKDYPKQYSNGYNETTLQEQVRSYSYPVANPKMNQNASTHVNTNNSRNKYPNKKDIDYYEQIQIHPELASNKSPYHKNANHSKKYHTRTQPPQSKNQQYNDYPSPPQDKQFKNNQDQSPSQYRSKQNNNRYDNSYDNRNDSRHDSRFDSKYESKNESRYDNYDDMNDIRKSIVENEEEQDRSYNEDQQNTRYIPNEEIYNKNPPADRYRNGDDRNRNDKASMLNDRNRDYQTPNSNTSHRNSNTNSNINGTSQSNRNDGLQNSKPSHLTPNPNKNSNTNNANNSNLKYETPKDDVIENSSNRNQPPSNRNNNSNNNDSSNTSTNNNPNSKKNNNNFPITSNTNNNNNKQPSPSNNNKPQLYNNHHQVGNNNEHNQNISSSKDNSNSNLSNKWSNDMNLNINNKDRDRDKVNDNYQQLPANKINHNQTNTNTNNNNNTDNKNSVVNSNSNDNGNSNNKTNMTSNQQPQYDQRQNQNQKQAQQSQSQPQPQPQPQSQAQPQFQQQHKQPPVNNPSNINTNVQQSGSKSLQQPPSNINRYNQMNNNVNVMQNQQPQMPQIPQNSNSKNDSLNNNGQKTNLQTQQSPNLDNNLPNNNNQNMQSPKTQPNNMQPTQSAQLQQPLETKSLESQLPTSSRNNLQQEALKNNSNNNIIESNMNNNNTSPRKDSIGASPPTNINNNNDNMGNGNVSNTGINNGSNNSNNSSVPNTGNTGTNMLNNNNPNMNNVNPNMKPNLINQQSLQHLPNIIQPIAEKVPPQLLSPKASNSVPDTKINNLQPPVSANSNAPINNNSSNTAQASNNSSNNGLKPMPNQPINNSQQQQPVTSGANNNNMNSNNMNSNSIANNNNNSMGDKNPNNMDSSRNNLNNSSNPVNNNNGNMNNTSSNPPPINNNNNSSVSQQMQPQQPQQSQQPQQNKNQNNINNNSSMNPQPQNKPNNEPPKVHEMNDNIFQNKNQIQEQSKPNIQNFKKQIKMLPGKNITPPLIQQFLRTRNITKSYLQSFLGEQFQYCIHNMNVYYVDFILNDKLAVFAICSADNNNDYTIRMWAPIADQCPDEMNGFLFKKYMGYLEKFTMLNYIKIKLANKAEAVLQFLYQNGFKQTNTGALARKRTTPITKSIDFQPFLACQFSTITFVHANIDHSYLYSEQIQPMTTNNSYTSLVFPYLSVNQLSSNQPQIIQSALSLVQKYIKVVKNIKNYLKLNQILKEEELDDYQFEQNMNINDIGCAMLNLSIVLGGKVGAFFTQQTQMFVDALVFRQNGFTVAQVESLFPYLNIYVFKGLSVASQCSNYVRQNASKNFKKQKIGIKMFSKIMYGRVVWNNNEDQSMRQLKYGCYGNWQLNLAWQDMLQGKIIHSIEKCELFGNNQPFYLTISLQNQPIYCCLIEGNNFIG